MIAGRTYRALRIGASLLAVAACAGCASIPERYTPAVVGACGAGESIDGLEVLIRPQADEVVFGHPIVFEITLRNRGDHPLWVPKKPDVILVWVYPDGHRDNFVREPTESRFFRREDAVLLHPGQELSTQAAVKTRYFPRPGVTEFKAIYQAEENTNPDLTPFWQGRAVSNSYGVLVEPPERTPSRTSATGSCLPTHSSAT